MSGPYWRLFDDSVPSETMGREYDYDAEDSVHGLHHEDFPDFEPNFRTPVVKHLTDLLGANMIADCGFFVGPRLRAVFDRHALMPHRYYPVPLTVRRKPVDGYAWLHLPHPLPPLPEDATTAQVEAAILADPRLVAVDLIRLHYPSAFNYYHVSPRLKEAIEADGLTGMKFKKGWLFGPTG